VFGSKAASRESGVPGQLVGFMPQEKYFSVFLPFMD